MEIGIVMGLLILIDIMIVKIFGVVKRGSKKLVRWFSEWGNGFVIRVNDFVLIFRIYIVEDVSCFLIFS